VQPQRFKRIQRKSLAKHQQSSVHCREMNVSGENIDELLASATKNGMYLVNDSNTDALEQEYEEGIITVDTLCEVVDPETTPFDSKYKARKLLDDLCNKLEATRTIASLEKKSDVIHRMNKKIGKA
jgi:hypothetical protein